MTKNKWYILIAVVVAAAVVGWLLWGRQANAPAVSGSVTPAPTGFIFSPTPLGGATASPAPSGSEQSGGNQWQGTLQVSDNSLRGNLMLIAKIQGRDNFIYIRTARDFTTLVGKAVMVTYDGTLDKFILLNIIAK